MTPEQLANLAGRHPQSLAMVMDVAKAFLPMEEALQHLLDDLSDLGFGTDEAVDDAQAVDCINKHFQILKESLR